MKKTQRWLCLLLSVMPVTAMAEDFWRRCR